MCDTTELGETVCAVGSASALGAWSVRGGVRLKTSARSFPVWKSRAPVHLSIECTEDFKFVVLTKATDVRVRSEKWEDLPENRRIQVRTGFELYIRAAWNDPKSVVTMLPLTPERAGELERSALFKHVADGGAVAAAPHLLAEDGHALHPRWSSPTALTAADVAVAAPVAAAAVGGAARGHKGGDLWNPQPKGIASAASASGSANGALNGVFAIPGIARLHTRGNGRTARPGLGTALPQQRQFCRAGSDPSSLGRSLCGCGAIAENGRLRQVPVIIASSEMAPFSQTGGLGLVAASFARELAWRGHRTMAVTPMYESGLGTMEGMSFVGSAWIRLHDKDHEVRYYHHYHQLDSNRGCDYVLLDHACFQNRPLGLYCNAATGEEYADNVFRFALLSLAALEAPLLLKLGDITFGEDVVFLANDWQAGLLPVYLRHKYRPAGVYSKARVIYVVHNLGYQGAYDFDCYAGLGLTDAAAQELELDGSLNISKAALISADLVVAVSPTYANEIQTESGGSGLDRYARQKGEARRVIGILNGIDGTWDPQRDPYILRRYTQADYQSGRAACKAWLQRMAGLQPDRTAVLLGYVGRLTWQKGVDVLLQILDWILLSSRAEAGGTAQLIIMGEGDKHFSNMAQQAQRQFPGCVSARVKYDRAVEHQMMAGCDIITMPSRYEPCGLPQMIAQKYGAVPVVTDTGGLHDTVRGLWDYGVDATGFIIPQPIHDSALRKVLLEAMQLFHNEPILFRRLQENAMAQEFGWQRSIDRYERQIQRVLAMPCAP